MTLRAGLDYRLRNGKYKRKILKDVIEKDPNYIDQLRNVDGITLDADALIALINARDIKLRKLSRYCDLGRR